jgi:acyl-coenzyme A thioesterase PaaI-like protein
VRAIGTTSHVGRSTAVAEAKLIGVEDGRLYATASTTCMVFAPNP